MTNVSELARLAATLFYSGVFWMMVMFLVENGTGRTSKRAELVPWAFLLMVFSAYLTLGVVVHQTLFAMPIGR
jgi:hypothetical protein